MKYILFTIAFLLASNCLKAQGQFEKVIGLTGAQGFPQPGVSNANTQGKIPVGLYTGTPNISIPLYEFKLRDNIQLPINLNYHIYNVKPNNLPSEVGLGWSLECGGCITRIIKNEPDISYESSSNEYKPITTEADLLTTADILVRVSGNYINTQDEYQFNFLGYTGSFMYSQEKSKWINQILTSKLNLPRILTIIPVLNLPVHFLNFTTIADQKEPDLRTLYHVG